MSGIIYTPPAGVGVTPDLNTVMMAGNSTAVNYVGTGIELALRRVIGPTIYTAGKMDFVLLCDVSAGNVTIRLPPSVANVFVIKLDGYTPPNKVIITVIGGGTVDGLPYELTQKHASVIVTAKGDGVNYIVLGSHQSLSSTASGTYSVIGFAGTAITMPHTLNAIPTGVSITPGSFNATLLLQNAYFITVDAVNITIDFGVPLANPGQIDIFWSVTRN